MPPRAYPKVNPGDPFNFPAGLQNDLIDLLNSTGVGNKQALGLIGAAAQGVVVMVKNTSGADRLRWDCVALDTTLRYALGSNGVESVIFNAITADPNKPAAILQEPIANNKLGRALIFGYTLARCQSGTATLTAARPANTANLQPIAGGSVRLLAAPSPSAASLIPVLIGFGGRGITDLRVQGNNLQFFMDGVWSTWHTGTTCA